MSYRRRTRAVSRRTASSGGCCANISFGGRDHKRLPDVRNLSELTSEPYAHLCLIGLFLGGIAGQPRSSSGGIEMFDY